MIEGLAVGRIVHFVDDAENTYAAIVNKVWDRETGSSNLTVFTGDPANPVKVETSRLYSETREPFTWRWPPRDDD